MSKVVAIAVALAALPAFAKNTLTVDQQATAVETTAALQAAIPPLPSKLKGTTSWVWSGREYRADVTLMIKNQGGGTGTGTYTRYNSVAMSPPCNSYSDSPMSFTWDGVTFNAVVREGDRLCEKRFSIKRGTEHYFVFDDPANSVHSYLDVVE